MSTAKQSMVIDRMHSAATDVVIIDLKTADGGTVESWEPGAHIDLHLPSGLIRQYSLCGDPAQSDIYRIAVLREKDGRGGSAEVHDVLKEGATVTVSSPRNHFALQDADSYVFVGGGIGITPLLPMMREATKLNKPWRLIYGGRTRASMAFLDEISQYPANTVEIVPQDEFGLLDLDRVVSMAEPGVAVYSCGPNGMLSELENKFEQLGKRKQLVIERFGADGTAESDPEGRRPFQVELAKKGVTLDVPADKSLKDVLLDVGIDIFSCEEGYCGSCETQVLEGVPEHHCSVLTPEEREQGELMMVCVGRAKTDKLILDL